MISAPGFNEKSGMRRSHSCKAFSPNVDGEGENGLARPIEIDARRVGEDLGKPCRSQAGARARSFALQLEKWALIHAASNDGLLRRRRSR